MHIYSDLRLSRKLKIFKLIKMRFFHIKEILFIRYNHGNFFFDNTKIKISDSYAI